MSKLSSFEIFFRSFVEWFGGTVLIKEAPVGKTADYLFMQYSVIAELKTLLEDSTSEMNERVKKMIVSWMAESDSLPTHTIEDGKIIFELRSVEVDIAYKWVDHLRQQVERLVKEANSQIAETKRRENLPNARGILLIHNTSNTYHNDPRGYRDILGSLLKKHDPHGSLRYPHIQGAVYFSKDVKSVKENMPFWTPLQMKQAPDEDVSDIIKFQRDL
jgi:hypothetical protein